MKHNSAIRMEVYKKCNGHCAYCGCVITYKQMQVDHYWPQCRKHHQPGSCLKAISLKENEDIKNLMPSCRKCNIHKHGWPPEEWRRQLQRQIVMLRKNAQFDRALRFGQIEITETPIVFYYEMRFIGKRGRRHEKMGEAGSKSHVRTGP